jgi:hypothetical protein
MRYTFAAAVALGALSIAACSSLDHGTVTAKQYDPSWISYSQICSFYSEEEEEEQVGTTEEMVTVQGPCVSWIPIQTVEPDCWELDLRSGSDTGSQCVDETTYQRYRVGQQYP